ncbi:MAG: solute carrier family 23 protein [Eubacteriales bacterium]|nr:solute carrier family 23 protein [Eubacteriales bacterium]
MKLVYNVQDRPPFARVLVFALQQVLAILAATIAVPTVINNNQDIITHFGMSVGMSQSAALLGAGIGTLVYLLFTKFKSPVFLGSSFAFLGSMAAAFCGAVSINLGFTGLLLGAVFAGLVYVVIAIVVKYCGTKWINKLMPAVVIGPTVAIIGLSLAGNAVGDLTKGNGSASVNTYVALICGLVTLGVTIVASVYGKKMMKMIPFIIGICAGYAVAAVFTVIGNVADIDALKVINFSIFKQLTEAKAWYPDFTFIHAFKGFKDITGSYIATVAVAYVPVAFVVFAEHIADHKNLSTIIEKDLLTEPGLDKTLLGDGVGSAAGAFFGGCPNTTYGESVGCVAISGNASVVTILVTACMAILAAFLAPFVLFLATIPSCVMGGVCVALYGFIAVSGLKMIQNVDLGDNRNMFTVSVILITGIGGLVLTFGKVTITSVACALILGILTNLLVNIKKDKTTENAGTTAAETETAETAEVETKEPAGK